MKADPMLRAAALLWIFLAMMGAAVAQDTKPDTVQVHGKALALSCAEWKRNPDGSWVSTGPLLVGAETVNSVTLHGAKETSALETKCANGASPVAKSSPSDDPTKHRGHKHHSAEPGDGT
jgi:hypothetical protein